MLTTAELLTIKNNLNIVLKNLNDNDTRLVATLTRDSINYILGETKILKPDLESLIQLNK